MNTEQYQPGENDKHTIEQLHTLAETQAEWGSLGDETRFGSYEVEGEEGAESAPEDN